ncbi:MAG: protein of unknown function DUF1073 [Caudoviricetes sp.]|nr:MAG: protein of unknown function DUF1073 [Caudoviricetes sp.]
MPAIKKKTSTKIERRGRPSADKQRLDKILDYVEKQMQGASSEKPVTAKKKLTKSAALKKTVEELKVWEDKLNTNKTRKILGMSDNKASPTIQYRQVYNELGKMVDSREYILDQQKKHGQDQTMKLAMDSAYPINPAPNFAQIDALLIDSTFLGYPQMSMLMQNGIFSRILNILADEMFRKGYKFVCTGEEDKSKKIKELEKEFERLDVNRKLHWGTKITFAQGSCLVVPKIKGDDTKLAKEFIVDSPQFGKGDLEYITIVEPPWYIPVYFNTWNPRSDMFYKVQTYSLMGTIIDHTRVIKMTYNEAPNLWKPVYNFNGIPLLQQCIPYVMKFEAILDEIVNIISRYNLTIFKGDLESLIGMNSEEVTADSDLINRLRIFNLLRNNTGAMAVDMAGEDIVQLQIQLGTLDKLLSQFTEFLAIVPGLTTTKLFGQPLQGMNSTGEFELKSYYDEIGNKQKMLSVPLNRIKELAMVNMWGEIDPDITIEFEKLNENTPKEEAEINFIKAQTGQLLITSGAIPPSAETQRIIDDVENDYAGLDIDPDDMDKLAQERQEQEESLPVEEEQQNSEIDNDTK